MSRLYGYEPAVQVRRLDEHDKQFEAFLDEMKATRRALYTFALSIAGGAIVAIISVLQVT